MPQEKWTAIERSLRQLGVPKATIGRVKEARNYCAAVSGSGVPCLPGFTLHNYAHSDNVIFLLTRLKDVFKYELNEYEAYLLATSAYLHDLGMFFSEERFRREILPNPAQALRACPQNQCDRVENYALQGKRTGEQVRETHNLLSIYMLRKDSSVRSFVEGDNLPYLMTICRGHRKADLRAQGCRCYKSEPWGGNVIRVGLLAALLRLAGALDFYGDRASRQVFKQRALDFLSDPLALRHWLRHYFVIDPSITQQDQSGNFALVCTVNFRVPMKQINNVPYLSFFRPLLEEHIAEVNREDLDINKYPPVFTEALHVTSMQATLSGDQRDGFRDLPVDVTRRIGESGAKDVLAFLQWLQSDTVRIEAALPPTAGPRQPDVYSHYENDHSTMPTIRPEPAGCYDNPFYHRDAIKDQSYFFGRERETQKILTRVRRKQCVSIVGPRHIGKTSLLFHVADEQVLAKHGLAPDKFVVVYCTGQGLRSDGDGLGDRQSYLLQKVQSRISLDIAYRRFDDIVEHLTREGLTVVLLLDEFELFAVNSSVKEDFFHNLRALQSQYALTTITSSQTPLRELSCRDDSSLPHNFFQMFHPLELGLFSSQEAQSLIELSRRAGITFSERTVEFILDMAGFHPFFLQVACDHVFELCSIKAQLDDSDYEGLCQEISSELESHFRYYWDNLDPVQQSVLANLEAVQASCDHAPHLKELARQGLVTKEGSIYAYVSTSFREFVQKHRAAILLRQESKSLIGRELGSVRIVGEIGSGGMATVYKAYQPLLERDVAVKVLSLDVRRGEFLQRFRREAQAVAKLRHPNILSIHDFGVEDDLAYIIMDYVPGGTLADLVDNRLPLERAIDITIQVGDALHYAHTKGIVHRDVKPANILMDTNGRPLLTDFGLVKFLTASEQLTKHGTEMIGTAAFVAPEQVRGGEVDARSDVYALGTVLYKMVTGCLPFEMEDGVGVFRKVEESPMPPTRFNSSLPIEVEQVILKAIAREPEDRYQSALEMVEALQGLAPAIYGPVPVR